MSPSNLTPSPKPVTLHRPPEETGAAAAPDHRASNATDAPGDWAVAMILPCPLPPRLLAQPQPGEPRELPEAAFYVGAAPIYGPPPYGNGEDDYAALYAPPEACFVLAIDPFAHRQAMQPQAPLQVGSGSSTNVRRDMRWQDVEIVLRSPHAWVVDLATPGPPATPAFIALVHELAHRAQSLGWEPAGRGLDWYNLRFRRSWADLGGTQHRG